ncbi:MAG: hypothetical protein ACRDNI_07315 [Gaiellaceae bacterium]
MLGLAGAALAQTPSPDPAPVPAPPPPVSPPPPPAPPVAPPVTTPPTQESEPAPKSKRPRSRARARDRDDDAAGARTPPDPARGELGAASGRKTSAPATRPAAIAHIPRALAEPERRWPAQAALLFVFAVGLVGLVLALAPVRVLGSISADLPRHRQDFGIALVLVMALGAGFLVLLAAA